MKNLSLLYLLKKFIHTHRKFVIFLIFTICLFLGITYLYGESLTAVSYSIEILCFIVVLWGIYEFYMFYKKHKQLSITLNNTDLFTKELPYTSELLEHYYQLIIEKLQRELNAAKNITEKKYKEEIDYYTMWVHQIKTPISAMYLLLQDSNIDNTEVEVLKQELFKIEQYVEMVLQYLRIESLSSDLKLQEYELYDIVKQTIRKYSVIFIHKKISLDLQEFQCTVLTDEKWLAFMIEQLLSNALKYTHQGEIRIYMAPDDAKCLVIEDTGIGIQKEDIDRIFEKGFTGFNGRMHKKSSGIGLYLCKQVAAKLSHKISITSEVGKGTMVKIDLSSEKIEIY